MFILVVLFCFVLLFEKVIGQGEMALVNRVGLD